VPDDAAQALAGGGELVFQFGDAVLGVPGLGGAGVALGCELARGFLQLRDAGDELGSFGSLDLGAELKAEPAEEFT
jgi:hypothetical protein